MGGIRTETTERKYESIALLCVRHYKSGGNYKASLTVAFLDGGSIVEIGNMDVWFDSPVNVTDDASFRSAIQTRILAYATAQSYSMTASDIIWGLSSGPTALADTPQPAITNAPADANDQLQYGNDTLGALTGAVNTANTKQNDYCYKTEFSIGSSTDTRSLS